MPDDEWLAIVGAKGWTVSSHDAKWRRPEESAAMKAIQQHRIGCFYLWGASMPICFKLKSLAHNYDKIAKVCRDERRPYIHRATAENRLRRIV